MRLAALQMVSEPTITGNLATVEHLIATAAERGAELVALPENFALMPMDPRETVAAGEADGSGPLQDFLRLQARRHRIWLVGGTIPIAADDPERVRSACLVFDDQGRRVVRYDKIHLFDARVEDQQGHYLESSTFEAGVTPVVCDTPIGRMGLSICYDLRFPELYRRLEAMGAEILVIPSAFTAVTGQAHWEVLLRARAIENLCYVVAPAQGGRHRNGRETHGDTMIVEPWGCVQQRLRRGAGIVLGNIDRTALHARRQALPCLEHRRLVSTMEAGTNQSLS